ncbi:MAG: MotA/TolQ/ExbB proton channel family protein [Pirellulaceae bacterium]
MQIVTRSVWTKLFLFTMFVIGMQTTLFLLPGINWSGSNVVVAQEENVPVADAGNAKEESKPKDISVLGWLIEALGWLYILVFLALSFVMVGLVIINILAGRRDYVCPQTLIDGFESLLDEKKYQDAYELAKTDGSFLGNVLSSGLAKLSSGYDHAIEAMQEVGTEENMKIQHRLSYLALIGNIAPMVGLLGTVDGMVRAFFEIATAGGTPDADKLADGIAKALVTTLVGLLIAIPAIAAFTILRNRFEQLELEVGINSGNLMGRFEKVGTKKNEVTTT